MKAVLSPRPAAPLPAPSCSTTGWRPPVMWMVPEKGDVGADIAVLDRHFRQRRQHVQLGHRGGGLLDYRKVFLDRLPHRFKQFRLQCQLPFGGREHPVFQFL